MHTWIFYIFWILIKNLRGIDVFIGDDEIHPSFQICFLCEISPMFMCKENCFMIAKSYVEFLPEEEM